MRAQPEVEQLLRQMNATGKLNGFDFQNTVFNFMLPRGVVLTIDDGSGDEARSEEVAPAGETEEKASSLEGLGGGVLVGLICPIFMGSWPRGQAAILIGSEHRKSKENVDSTTWSATLGGLFKLPSVS